MHDLYVVFISGACLIPMILFTIYHTVQSHKMNVREKKKKKYAAELSLCAKTWYKFLSFLCYFVIFVYILHVVFIISIEMYSFYYINNDSACALKWNLLAFSVHFTKFSIYLLFITRIYCAFIGSVYGYSMKLICGLYFYVCVYLGIATYNDFHYISAKWNPTTLTCDPSIPFVSMISTLVVDVSLSILSIILFAKPLHSLMKATSFKNPKLTNLVIKKCTLVFIALISTMIMVLVLFTSSIMLLEIDDLINLLCVSLMNKVHQRTYTKLCGKMCHKKIAICLGSKENVKQLLVRWKSLPTTTPATPNAITTTKDFSNGSNMNEFTVTVTPTPSPNPNTNEETVTSFPDTSSMHHSRAPTALSTTSAVALSKVSKHSQVQSISVVDLPSMQDSNSASIDSSNSQNDNNKNNKVKKNKKKRKRVVCYECKQIKQLSMGFEDECDGNWYCHKCWARFYCEV